MIRIGICDEDQNFINNLVEILSGIFFQYGDWETEVFYSGKDVLSQIEKGTFDCDLLLMDIGSKDDSGLLVAKKVNEKRIDTDIIFIASSEEYVFECYRYHTFAYLLKPLKQQEFEFELKRYINEMNVTSKCLHITQWGNEIPIPLRKITYIESNYRKVIVHTSTEDYEYYAKLNDLEKVLHEDGFIRCHQSYLVAKDKITNQIGNEIMLGDSITLPVSRRYMDNIREQVFDEIAATQDSQSCYVTKSLSQNREKTGALVCIKGAYVGGIVRIRPEQKILIGRDGNVADMVVNLPEVSRLHCAIIYHEATESYEVVDFSTNGTYVNTDKRLIQDETYLLKSGTTISFGDRNTVYKLG